MPTVPAPQRHAPHAAAKDQVAPSYATRMQTHRNVQGCSAGHRLVAEPDVRQVAPRLADRRVELQRQRAAHGPIFIFQVRHGPSASQYIPFCGRASSWHVAGCARGASCRAPPGSSPCARRARRGRSPTSSGSSVYLQVRRPSRSVGGRTPTVLGPIVQRRLGRRGRHGPHARRALVVALGHVVAHGLSQ